MRLRPNNLCTFCNLTRESIQHIFVECIFVKQFWNELSSLLKDQHCIDRSFNFENSFILFGISSTQKVTKLFRYIMIVARYYIYKTRCEDSKPNILSFVQYLTNKHKTMKYIALKNQVFDKFNQEWMPWKCLLID